MNIDNIYDNLLHTSNSLNNLNIKSQGGIYALFIRKDCTLPNIKIPDNRLIYIGMSINLSEREYEAHFNSKNTGFSTVRRSLGAILKEELSLKSIPRGKGKTRKDFTNYSFVQEGEERLTEWMIKNLLIGFCTLENDIENIERELIKKKCPILCLKGCKNPFRSYIKSLRKKCVEEAEKSKFLDS